MKDVNPPRVVPVETPRPRLAPICRPSAGLFPPDAQSHPDRRFAAIAGAAFHDR